MRNWIAMERGKGSDYIDGGDGTQLRSTPAYIEYVVPSTQPPPYIITYWIALSQSKTDFFVAHCWGNEFDWPFHLLTYPATSAGAIKSALQAWPTFMALLSNSTQEKQRLSEGVI